MARKRDRAFAAFGAALFLITSSALTVAVIVSLVGENKKKDQTADTTTNTTSLKCATKAQEAPVNPPLQGTQLTNFTPIEKIDKLSCDDAPAGTGEKEVVATDTVTVHYTGAVAATGKIFQSSLDTGQPVSFPLSGVIPGWTQGVPGMKEGGTRRLYIPAALAYGANPPGGSGIPANADLVFDITLVKIGS